MPALNFKNQFVPKILSGDKSSTIRGKRKNPIKPGDRLILYTGMRTKLCQPIGTAICDFIRPVIIAEDNPLTFFQSLNEWHTMPIEDLYRMCVNDGFSDYEEMKTFFRNQYGLPFEGDLITWKDFKPGGWQRITRKSSLTSHV